MSNVINVDTLPDETEADARARLNLSPVARGALTIDAFTQVTLKSEIHNLYHQLNNADLDTETMLKAQAQTLDAIFNNLAFTASLNLNNINVFTSLMKLALQAQNQAGKTLQLIQQNKLLNVDENKTIETSEGGARTSNLVAFDRSKNSRRQEASFTKCV